MTQAFNLSQLANKVNTSGQLDVATGVTGTQAVANGGTGQSTYTDGQLLIGNSTGNTLTKTTLTAGSNMTITNGAGAITLAAAGGFQNMAVITTSGPGTWTSPPTTTRIKVTIVGGGAGGSFTFPGTAAAQGGSAGGSAIKIFPIASATGYSYTVGAGGAGGTGPSNAGAAGGSSSFGPVGGTTVSATGGATTPSGGQVIGGIGSNGDINFRGGSSIAAWSLATPQGFTGNNFLFPGAASLLGQGGAGGNSTSPAVGGTAGQFGGGGGAGRNPVNGGAGGAGVIIIEY
jgi:hypothetical protein